MERPDLDRLWETFRFSWDDLSSGGHIRIIRDKVAHAISILKARGNIAWYCFFYP
jgi:hypothetical protein